MSKIKSFSIYCLCFLMIKCASPQNTQFVGIQASPNSKTYKRIYNGNYSSTKGSIKETFFARNQSQSKKSFRNQRPTGTRGDIIDTAKKYIGVQYKYGGVDPSGFDCSGFTKYVYSKNGLELPRTSTSQYFKGHKISSSGAKPGDLVFFSTTPGKVSHVGIYLGGNQFIHSPSTGKSVEITELNNSYWKKHLIGFASFIK